MTISDDVVRLLRQEKGKLFFDDAGVEQLVKLLVPHEGDALFVAAHELLRLAHFLDVEKKSPAAAGTLVTLIVQLRPVLLSIDAKRAEALTDQAAEASKRLTAFSGDERVTKVLDTGARPKGTTPAGPMARFSVNKK